MKSIWSIVSNPDHRQILSWIGGGVVAVAAGVFALVSYVWPAEEGTKIVCAQQGSIASGRDTSHNTIIYHGSGPTNVGNGAAPCETVKK